MTITVAIGAAVAACGLGALVLLLTRARLLRPLSVLAGYMGRLAEGDYEPTSWP